MRCLALRSLGALSRPPRPCLLRRAARPCSTTSSPSTHPASTAPTARLSTRLAHAGCEVDPTTGALTPAIHLASTFERDEDLEYRREFIYGRVGNPTRALLERTLADLEAGSGALSFASGVAVAASVFQCFPGGCVIIPEDIYHGNRTLLRTVFAEWGLRVEEVDMTSLGAVEALLAGVLRGDDSESGEGGGLPPEKVLIWSETPSNPLFNITDIAAVSSLAKSYGVVHAVDSTWLTPYLCQPIALGADLVVHSTTKYVDVCVVVCCCVLCGAMCCTWLCAQ